MASRGAPGGSASRGSRGNANSGGAERPQISASRIRRARLAYTGENPFGPEATDEDYEALRYVIQEEKFRLESEQRILETRRREADASSLRRAQLSSLPASSKTSVSRPRLQHVPEPERRDMTRNLDAAFADVDMLPKTREAALMATQAYIMANAANDSGHMAQLRESALAGIRVLGREGALDTADPPPQRRSALAGRQQHNQVTAPEEPPRTTGIQPIDGELRHHLAQQRVDSARARRGSGGSRPIITADDDLCGAECFSHFIRTCVIPTGLEISSSFDKFDGQQDPRVWLEDFKAIVTFAGGSRDNALQLIQLYLKDAARAWLSGLAPESINSWEEFRRVFIANFKGTSKRPTSYEELRLCVQRASEPLRSYISQMVQAKVLNRERLE